MASWVGFIQYTISSLIYPRPPAGLLTMMPDFYHFVPPIAWLCSSLFCRSWATNFNCIPLRKSPHCQKLTFTPGLAGTRTRVHLQRLDLVILWPAGQNPKQVSFPASSTKLQLNENQFCCLETIYAVDEFEDQGSTGVRLQSVSDFLWQLGIRIEDARTKPVIICQNCQRSSNVNKHTYLGKIL
jgi:hypothetical protein